MKHASSWTLLFSFSLIAWSFLGRSPKAASAPPAAPAPGPWSTGAVGVLQDPSFGPGSHVIDLNAVGTYDAANWVSMLDYQSFTIQSGATVTLLPHASGAPVVLRAVGPVVIDGDLILSGADCVTSALPERNALPGPGGGRGGSGTSDGVSERSPGLGPGGGGVVDSTVSTAGVAGASHAYLGTALDSPDASPGPVYGTGFAIMRLGGSGGSGARSNGEFGGAAGGGALLLGSDDSIHLGGQIVAKGGDCLQGFFSGGAGSGGTLRLAAPTLSWSGATTHLVATGGASSIGADGADGWIRVETNGLAGGLGVIPSQPAARRVDQLFDFLPTFEPSVTLAMWYDEVGDVWNPIGQDPHGRLDAAWDISLTTSGTRTFRVESTGVALGAPLSIRVVDTQGGVALVGGYTVGENAGSTESLASTDVVLTIPSGVAVVQVSADLD